MITINPDGSKTFFVYGLGLISQETIQAGEQTGEFRVFHYDFRGSTTAITDEHGNITDRITYCAFGEITSRTGYTETIFLFAGRHGVQTDCNGLLYMRARYYSPQLNRFISPDPHWDLHNMIYGDNPVIIGSNLLPDIHAIRQSTNLYVYVMNNPIMFIDPSGRIANSANGNRMYVPEPRTYMYGRNQEGNFEVFDPSMHTIKVRARQSDRALDNFQTILDYAGMLPFKPISIPADITNGIIHLIRRNWNDAIWSFIFAIPIVEYVAPVIRAARGADTALGAGREGGSMATEILVNFAKKVVREVSRLFENHNNQR
jgi:RHS repeat-associated protein